MYRHVMFLFSQQMLKTACTATYPATNEELVAHYLGLHAAIKALQQIQTTSTSSCSICKNVDIFVSRVVDNARLHHCVRQKFSNFCSHTAGTLCPVPDRPSMLADTSISHRGIVHDIKYVHVFKKDIKVTETC